MKALPRSPWGLPRQIVSSLLKQTLCYSLSSPHPTSRLCSQSLHLFTLFLFLRNIFVFSSPIGFLLSPCLSRPWGFLPLHQNYKSSIPHWSFGVSYPGSQHRRKETAATDHFDVSIITCIHPGGWLNSGLEVRNKVLKQISSAMVYTPLPGRGFCFLVL